MLSLDFFCALWSPVAGSVPSRLLRVLYSCCGDLNNTAALAHGTAHSVIRTPTHRVVVFSVNVVLKRELVKGLNI